MQEAEFQTKALEAVHGITNTRQGKSKMRKFKRDNPHTFYGEQILVQSDNNYEFVKFAASPMGHGHVLNLNKWRYKIDGIVLNKTSCAFAVWEVDTWDSFVIVQECVVSMVVKKSITDCFIKFEVFYQVVTVGNGR